MTKFIQRIEIDEGLAIHCPFCGSKVTNAADDDAAEWLAQPCNHVLFAAHDMGSAYRSRRFDDNLSLVGIADDDIKLPDHGIDGLTDRVTIRNAIKFSAYVGPPSGYGSYVGFAPPEE